jgi:hypothetical protein
VIVESSVPGRIPRQGDSTPESDSARTLNGARGALVSLIAGLYDADPAIPMRAAAAIEKSTRQSPKLLQQWKQLVLEKISNLQDKEVRWHVAQLIPRLDLTPRELQTSVQILNGSSL